MVIKDVHDQITIANYTKLSFAEVKKMVRHQIQNYHLRNDAKALRDQYHDLLKRLSILSCLWIFITLEFITVNKNLNEVLIIVNYLTKKNYISCATKKMALLLKLLPNYFFKIFKSFIAFCYHLLQIKAFSLFQESEKIFVRSLVFLPTYLHFFNQL